MEFVISLPDEVGRQLLARARKEGLGVADFVAKVARREAKRPTIDEILAPVREQFVASGMTEEELTQLVKEERRALRQERDNGNV